MIVYVPGQTVLTYFEDGAIVGAFIGEEYLVGDEEGIFLSWSVMSRPGCFPRALAEAIEHAKEHWPHVTFFIPDKHPRAAALARLAQERYHAQPVEATDDGVYYRLHFKEARNGRITPQAERAERSSRPGS